MKIIIRAIKQADRAAVIAYLVEQGYKVSLEPVKVKGRNVKHLVLEDLEDKENDESGNT